MVKNPHLPLTTAKIILFRIRCNQDFLFFFSLFFFLPQQQSGITPGELVFLCFESDTTGSSIQDSQLDKLIPPTNLSCQLSRNPFQMKSSSNPKGYEMILFQGTSTKQKIEKKNLNHLYQELQSVCVCLCDGIYMCLCQFLQTNFCTVIPGMLEMLSYSLDISH